MVGVQRSKDGASSKDDTLKAGDYVVKMVNSKIDKTKKERRYIQLSFRVQSGVDSGFWLNENLWFDKATNKTLINSSQSRMDRIAKCLGLDPFEVKDTDQFLNKPLMVTVDHKLDTYWTDRNGFDTYENNILKYKQIEPDEAENLDREDPDLYSTDDPSEPPDEGETRTDADGDDIPF